MQLYFFFATSILYINPFWGPQDCVSFLLWKMVILNLQDKYIWKEILYKLFATQDTAFKTRRTIFHVWNGVGLLLPNAGPLVSTTLFSQMLLYIIKFKRNKSFFLQIKYRLNIGFTTYFYHYSFDFQFQLCLNGCAITQFA